jgi:hypothetical protein
MSAERPAAESPGATTGSRDPLDSWREWRTTCALAACSDAARCELSAFAVSRFRRMLRQCARTCRADGSLPQMPTPAEVCHLFETYFLVRGTSGGKRYKDWLFGRVAPGDADPANAVHGGAALIVREAVREYVRRETPPDNVVSLDAPLGGDTEGLTLADLLPAAPDPRNDLEGREYDRLSRRHAEDIFGGMTLRERIAVLAKSLGVSLAHREVARAAGCRKSVLSAAFQQFVACAAEGVRRLHAAEDVEALRALTALTFHHVRDFVVSWAGTNKACASLLMLGEH